MLAQKRRDDEARPIHYAGRTVTKAELNYATCEREALAVIFALRNFRHYHFSDKIFTVTSDRMTLKYASNHRDIRGWLAHSMYFPAGYDFNLQYRKGKNNHVADFLSRYSVGIEQDRFGNLEGKNLSNFSGTLNGRSREIDRGHDSLFPRN